VPETGFFSDDFDNDEVFALLFVVAIANANQLFAVTFKEFLGTFLTKGCFSGDPRGFAFLTGLTLS
jgi:hypothetical protein